MIMQSKQKNHIYKIISLLPLNREDISCYFLQEYVP